MWLGQGHFIKGQLFNNFVNYDVTAHETMGQRLLKCGFTYGTGRNENQTSVGEDTLLEITCVKSWCQLSLKTCECLLSAALSGLRNSLLLQYGGLNIAL